MAKRSQKARFGPGKDRIKPDTGNAATLELESEQAENSAGESEGIDSASEGGAKGNDEPESGTPENAEDGVQDNQLNQDQGVQQIEQADDELDSAYTSDEGDQNPQTCCSSCHTVFEVSQELLESSDTRVRCGECLSIFDALANLREHVTQSDTEQAALDTEQGSQTPSDVASATDESSSTPDKAATELDTAQDAAQDTAASSASPLDVTYADFGLFSADAGLPDVEYLDETREVPPFDFDDLGDDDDFEGTMEETLYSDDVIEDARAALSDGTAEEVEAATRTAAGAVDTRADASTAGTEREAVGEIDELLNTLQKPELPVIIDEEPMGAWWFRGLLFIGVLVLAAGLYGYRERDALQNNRIVRPVLESVCSVFGCTVPQRVDLAALKVTRRTVFSHPDVDDMLIINISFVNQATFGQRYPTLEVLLTNRNGGLIVRHDYQPSDYLDNWQEGDVLDEGKSLDVSLSVEDPGNEAMSFELDFR